MTQDNQISAKFRKMIVASLLGGHFVFLLLFWHLPDRMLHVSFLDVGQGDSIFIKTPENHQILVDGGPDSQVLNELTKVMPFFDKDIDLVVLSHPHLDHLGGLLEVFKHYQVKQVLITGVMSESPFYRAFFEDLRLGNVGILLASAEADLDMGSVVLDVLYPFEEVSSLSFENLNNSSIVAMVKYLDKRILLTGDAEKEVEEELVKKGVSLRANVLKVGHHGSRSSSTWEFLERVRPEIAVIQAGRGNSFGHPHEETLENLRNSGVKSIYRNDLEGRVDLAF